MLRFLFIVALVSAPLGGRTGLAQRPPGPLKLEHIDASDGLSHNTVYSIAQDRSGYMWFGTEDGLNRFDGYEFVVYRHDPSDTNSLSHNTVPALLAGRNGDLWVATESGLDRLDPETGGFIHDTSGRIYNETRKPSIFSLLEADHNQLWIGERHAVARFDEGGQRSDVLHLTSGGHRHPIFRSVDLKDNILWAATASNDPNRSAELYRYDVTRDSVEVVRHPFSVALDVDVGPSGAVWVAGGGVFGRIEKDRFVPEMRGISGQKVLEDRQGNVWLVGPEGWFRYDTKTRTLAEVHLGGGPTGPLARTVTTIFEDRAGAVWIGTLAGLFKYDPARKPFVFTSVDDAAIMSVADAEDQTIIIGTLGRGVLQYDQTSGRISEHRSGCPGSGGDDVWALHFDGRGMLWVGTENGMCGFNRESGSTQSVRLLPEEDPYVYVIKPDGQGGLWVGGQHLWHFDPLTAAVERIPIPTDNTGREPANVQALYMDDGGSLWVGLEFAGLMQLNLRSRAWTSYPFADADGLLGKAVRDIEEDEDGGLWLATDMGLVRMDRDDESFRHFLQGDGLEGSTVYALLGSQDSSLWLSTNEGLLRFDIETQHFVRFDENDGIGVTEFNRRAATTCSDGTVIFGGMGGFAQFRPEDVVPNTNVPPVVLTSVEKAGSNGTLRLLPTRVEGEGIVLDPSDLSFSVEFAALSYTRPDKNQYAYMLEGLDADWIMAGTRRFARYVGVPPGTYIFRVKGSNNDGVWNEAGLSFPVRVRPSLWQTWWFRLGSALFVLGLVIGAYRYRVEQLLKLERMRMRIAGDLHDDIGSKLGGIALMSEIVADRAMLPERERRQLQEITRSARLMAEDLRDIVWMVNPTYDTVDNLVTKMRQTADVLLADSAYVFNAPSNAAADLDMERRRHLYLMYREVLYNVSRHACASSVTIDVERSNGTLTLRVSDNGIGFDLGDAVDGEGLRNLRRRAEAVSGCVDVDARCGEGTTVTIVANLQNGVITR